MSEQFETMTVVELREYAREHHIPLPAGINKQGIIDRLKEVSRQTGASYFRATDNTKLAEIYAEINKMEKTRTSVESFPVYKELFHRYAVAALILLLLELLLRAVFLRRLP